MNLNIFTYLNGLEVDLQRLQGALICTTCICLSNFACSIWSIYIQKLAFYGCHSIAPRALLLLLSVEVNNGNAFKLDEVVYQNLKDNSRILVLCTVSYNGFSLDYSRHRPTDILSTRKETMIYTILFSAVLLLLNIANQISTAVSLKKHFHQSINSEKVDAGKR